MFIFTHTDTFYRNLWICNRILCKRSVDLPVESRRLKAYSQYTYRLCQYIYKAPICLYWNAHRYKVLQPVSCGKGFAKLQHDSIKHYRHCVLFSGTLLHGNFYSQTAEEYLCNEIKDGHGDVRPCDNIYEITYNSKPLELSH